MKKSILTIALLAIGVCTTIGFTHRNEKKKSVNTRINTKDLAEHGLTLIKSTNSYYKSVMGTPPQSQLNPKLEALKPYSVLLKNSSHKTLIAFNLKWEITKSDGQVLTAQSGHMNSRRLFNTRDKSKTKSVLEPGAALFCSVAGVADVSQLADVQFAGLRATVGPKGEAQSVQQASQDESSDTGIDNLIMHLSEAVSITVSIDGALFEDGTFVGTDSGNLFGWLSSLVKARKDLLQEMKTIQRDQNSDKVNKRLEEVSNSPKVDLGPESSSDDFYRFNRKRFAQTLLKRKTALGDDALRRELELLNDPWLNLRKL